MTTTTIIDLLRILTIRSRIFNQIEQLSQHDHKLCEDLTEIMKRRKTYVKGKSLVSYYGPLGMVARFAMPWSFVKHYLKGPHLNDDNKNLREHAVKIYMKHPNANIETLTHLTTTDRWFDGHVTLNEYDLDEIVGNMRLDILQFIYDRYYQPTNTQMPLSIETFDGACKTGNLQLVTFLHTHSKEGCTFKAMDHAAGNGSLDIVQFLHTHRTEGCSQGAIDDASGAGHLEIVKYLFENRQEGCTSDAMDFASEFGHIDILEYLLEHSQEGCTELGMDRAARAGRLDVIKWLHLNTTQGCSFEAMDQAATLGYFDIVKWLHDHRSEGCSTAAMDYASKNQHFQIVEWLNENRLEGSTELALDWAAENGSMETVQYLHQHRTEGGSERAIDWASKQHFDIVKFFYENRTERCSSNALLWACSCGQLDILKYLYYKGEVEHMVISDAAIEYGCQSGHLEVVRFLVETASMTITSKCVSWAAGYGHLDIIMYLDQHEKQNGQRHQGSFTTDAMVAAASGGWLSVVEYLHFNRTEGCTFSAMNMSILMGHAPVYEFLHTNRTEGCDAQAFGFACEQGNLEAVQFLITNYLAIVQSKRSSYSIHSAAISGFTQVVQFVLQNLSSSLTIPSTTAQSALKRGYPDIVALLNQYYPPIDPIKTVSDFFFGNRRKY
ncbi:hypothetical protein DFA_07750 [Cavenderia fasciculata]|uniref:Ankyrin repeat-containing protein n=1 Tax=Cavenderia fasciculata TaxID=261658 RepID=F4Q350_CACFS|nr:uncharacterized protein DFA_07750 [Cavenderia fasciculata]EGG16772.1 hypothetical protein DFA_07750 [Cavenderia fasciculata]|eukprot:XP_004355246.1 hypothetical protein DFA_07750 [Cavenderia fasciculata]